MARRDGTTSVGFRGLPGIADFTNVKKETGRRTSLRMPAAR